MRVEVPANSSARISMPCRPGQQMTTTLSLPMALVENGTSIYEVGSGEYEFTTPWQPAVGSERD